jgi:hypothetical protein
MRWGLLLGALAGALIAVTPASAAKKQPKPSLKAVSISVNRWVVYPGKTVKLNEDNGCFTIAGRDGVPPSVTAYFFVKAVRIPANAPTTFRITTPWDARLPPADSQPRQGRFSDFLFRSKGRPQAGIFGGAQGPYDRFTFSMLPTGLPTSAFYSGVYTIDVRTRVQGKTLTARAKVTVAC